MCAMDSHSWTQSGHEDFALRPSDTPWGIRATTVPLATRALQPVSLDISRLRVPFCVAHPHVSSMWRMYMSILQFGTSALLVGNGSDTPASCSETAIQVASNHPFAFAATRSEIPSCLRKKIANV